MLVGGDVLSLPGQNRSRAGVLPFRDGEVLAAQQRAADEMAKLQHLPLNVAAALLRNAQGA